MEMQINAQEIMNKLAQIDSLRQDFEDAQLSEEDIKALELAEEEYKNGELVSLEDIEKELEIN